MPAPPPTAQLGLGGVLWTPKHLGKCSPGWRSRRTMRGVGAFVGLPRCKPGVRAVVSTQERMFLWPWLVAWISASSSIPWKRAGRGGAVSLRTSQSVAAWTPLVDLLASHCRKGNTQTAQCPYGAPPRAATSDIQGSLTRQCLSTSL